MAAIVRPCSEAVGLFPASHGRKLPGSCAPISPLQTVGAVSPKRSFVGTAANGWVASITAVRTRCPSYRRNWWRAVLRLRAGWALDRRTISAAEIVWLHYLLPQAPISAPYSAVDVSSLDIHEFLHFAR
jgi:hypothetical protein